MACFTLKFYFSDRRLCHRECQIKLSMQFQPLLGFGERWSICCLGSRKVRNPWRPKRLHLQSRVSNYWMYFVFKMCMYLQWGRNQGGLESQSSHKFLVLYLNIWQNLLFQKILLDKSSLKKDSFRPHWIFRIIFWLRLFRAFVQLNSWGENIFFFK